jgi:hypothetical protein
MGCPGYEAASRPWGATEGFREEEMDDSELYFKKVTL